MESAAEGPHKGQPQSRETRGNTPTAKRTRVLLSCHTCRVSKLKCDRAQPCGQCLRKGRADRCYYAPKPEKQKQPAAESMAARLRRLESMVRKVMDDEGGGQAPAAAGPDQTPGEGLDVKGQVVKVDRSTTYVGATHFMAILEDVSQTARKLGQCNGTQLNQSSAD